MDPLKVVVTGANGQIAYSFVFALGMGNVFGDSRRIDLRLYDLPGTETRLAGLRMELEDCAFPLLENISVHTDFNHASDGIDVAFLIGASPRGIGMERADLLIKNAHIFKEQGSVLNRCADSNAKIFVVGNPANTNCLIAMNHAPNLKRANFHSMMRLDQNRMQACLAQKIERSVDDIQHCVVWGNHSLKQVPDFTQAVVGKHGEDLKPVSAIIGDRDWLENVMIPTVQKRGAAVIESRGSSSAGSASRALAAAAKSLFVPVEGEWFSSGVCSDNNGYGIESDLIFSFPCRATGGGDYEIISDLPMDNFIKSRILLSEEELIQERSTVQSL